MGNYFHSTKAYPLNPEFVQLFASTFHTTYNILSKIKNNILSDFTERKSNSKIPFSFLLKIIIKFEFILSFYYFLLSFIYLFKTDKLFDFKYKKNTEISKYSCNIFKGITGMNRDLNMIVIQFHKSYRDTREVFLFSHLIFK
jgi:hypothetical protein